MADRLPVELLLDLGGDVRWWTAVAAMRPVAPTRAVWQDDPETLLLMMSLETIRAINEELAARAAEEQRVPFVPDGPEDVDRWPPFPFPNFGCYEPPGWEIAEEDWFVDSTGRGREGEPALTVEQFRMELRRHITEHPGDGLAITGEGASQLVVSAFRRAIHEALEQREQAPNRVH